MSSRRVCLFTIAPAYMRSSGLHLPMIATPSIRIQATPISLFSTHPSYPSTHCCRPQCSHRFASLRFTTTVSRPAASELPNLISVDISSTSDHSRVNTATITQRPLNQVVVSYMSPVQQCNTDCTKFPRDDMVAKRRSNGSGISATNDAYTSRSEGEDSDTSHVQNSRLSKICPVPITPKLPTSVMSATPSSTDGMEDISRTSPSIGESLRQDTMKILKRKRASPVPDGTLFSALRRVASQPRTSKGSAHNPIDLEEYSPRRKPIPLPKRKQPSVEPHKFLDRHRKLYTYRPPRTALAPKPANGSTFTGHKGDDMYRMMNAKMTAVGCPPPAPYEAPPGAYGNVSYDVPFEVQYPMSARYLAQQPATQDQHQSPYAQCHRRMGISLSGESEDTLRKKAVQYIRECSRPQPHNKMLSDDTDETSPSNSDATIPTDLPAAYCAIPVAHTSPATRTPNSKVLHVYNDPNNHITQLIAQTSLLTSLMQVYHKSTDQRGLREDIVMLVSVQNQCVNKWMKAESQISRKRPRSNTGSAISVGSEALDVGRAQKTVTGKSAEEDEEKKRDEEVRELLSAGAGMWQDGSGVGVADVFATQDALAPATRIDDSVRVSVRGESRVYGESKRGACGWKMAE